MRLIPNLVKASTPLIFLVSFPGMFSSVDGLEVTNGVIGKIGGGVPLVRFPNPLGEPD